MHTDSPDPEPLVSWYADVLRHRHDDLYCAMLVADPSWPPREVRRAAWDVLITEASEALRVAEIEQVMAHTAVDVMIDLELAVLLAAADEGDDTSGEL